MKRYKRFLSADNMKNTGLYEHVYDLSINYYSIDVADRLDIHKNLMVKNDIY